jgi:hypothetical protein
LPTSLFASIDPNRPGQTPTQARPAARDTGRAGAGTGGSDGWAVLLADCWREIAAETETGLGRADGHDVLAYTGTVLRVVEHALIELIRDPRVRACCEPRGSLWCAAQALDASALVSHRWRSAAGRRFQALGSALERRVQDGSGPPPSSALIAAGARRAIGVLEEIAGGAPPTPRALDVLDEAALALATVGIQVWSAERAVQSSGASPRLGAVAQALAVDRQTAELLATATNEAGALHAEQDGVGDWLAIAISRRLPAGPVAAIDDPGTDRVLRAESQSVLRAAWISRGAAELLALRRLDDESQGSPRRHTPWPAQRAAAARAAIRPVQVGDLADGWRGHSLALARAVGTYLGACAGDKRWIGQTREELVELLADSLAHAAKLDALLGADGQGRFEAHGA